MTLLGSCLLRSFPRSPPTARPAFQHAKRAASGQASSQQWREQARTRFGRSSCTVDDMVGDHAQCGRWSIFFFSAYGTWKRRSHTAAWHRHIKDIEGGCRKTAERLAGKANRAAKFQGAIRAGAPKRPTSYTQAIARPLTAYFTSQERRRHIVTIAHVPPLSLSLPSPSRGQPCTLTITCQDILNAALGPFKSSEVLALLNHLARISFTLLPIVAALRFKTVRLMRRQGVDYVARFFHPSRFFTVSLFLTPFALLGLAYLASLERTPITGRVRSLFVSEWERAGLTWRFLDDLDKAGATIFGATVIPAKEDWRAGFVEDTLRSLEVGIPLLGQRSSMAVAGLLVPPAEPPLAFSRLAPSYQVALVDRAEPNAYSFGFAPFGGGVGPGFVVVHAGYVDAILSRNGAERTQAVVSTREREDLAVVLAHELAHLLCSHTLEVQASATQQPRMRTIFVDALRTAVYPFTALLGPFANEYVSDLLQQRFVEPYRIASACESRVLEHEADAVSLRILANAGYDPRCAIRFWESQIAARPRHTTGGAAKATVVQSHAGERSHPVDEERLRAIREDLSRWTRV